MASANKERNRYAVTLLGRYSQKTTTMVPLTTGPKGGPSPIGVIRPMQGPEVLDGACG